MINWKLNLEAGGRPDGQTEAADRPKGFFTKEAKDSFEDLLNEFNTGKYRRGRGLLVKVKQNEILEK